VYNCSSDANYYSYPLKSAKLSEFVSVNDFSHGMETAYKNERCTL